MHESSPRGRAGLGTNQKSYKRREQQRCEELLVGIQGSALAPGRGRMISTATEAAGSCPNLRLQSGN